MATAVVITLATTLAQQALKSAQNVINRPTGDPIKVLALELERRPSDSFLFQQPLDLTPTDLQTVNAASHSASDAFDDWARAHGGAPDNSVMIKLVVEGNRDTQIRLLDLRADKQCRDPLTGALVYSPAAGADDTIRLGLDLDQPLSVAKELQSGTWGGEYFKQKTVSLQRGEQQTFEITAQTIRYYCEFGLDFTVLDGTETITQVIKDGGKPFRVSALAIDPAGDQYPFAKFETLYVGGVGNPDGSGNFVRADPATFHE